MQRIALLGVEVDPLPLRELSALVAQAIERGERWIVANHNLHSVYLFHRDPKMRSLYRQARLIHIDGMSLVWWGRILGYRLNRSHRVTYVNWVYPLMAQASQRGWRVFYLGGKPGVAERAAQILRGRLPGLQIRTHHGYFSKDENERVLSAINSYRPHILMVGMGMPRQERWVVDNLEYIQANAILTAGGCFDYVAGVIPTPPRWMGRLSLEWLFRLGSEPRRLWRRYLIEPWFLVLPAARDVSVRLRGRLGRR